MSYRRLHNRVNEAAQTDMDSNDEDEAFRDATAEDDDALLNDDEEVTFDRGTGPIIPVMAPPPLPNLTPLPPQLGAGAMATPDLSTVPGLDPATAAVLAMMQANTQAQIQAMMHQMAEMQRDRGRRRSRTPPTPAPRTAVKPPVFDIEKGRDQFQTWKSKWNYYQTSSGIAAMRGSQQRLQKRAALQLAMSDDTIRWVTNQGMTDEESENADRIVARLEAYVRGTTNPLVQVVEMIGRKKIANESFEKFLTDLKEKAKLCAFDKVTNVGDWFLTSCICANVDDPDVRKKLLLEEKLTLEKAVKICQEEEKAAKTAKQLGDRTYAKAVEQGATTGTEANATSTYKRGRNQQSQNAQGGQQQQQQQQQTGRNSSQDRSRYRG